MTSKLILHPLIILAVCVSLLLFIPNSSPALAQDPPLVLALYYAWYDQDTWHSKLPAGQPIQPYTSSDPATIERHVSQAQAAGIDALIQSWYGPHETNNQTETNFRMLLDLAAARGFKAAVDFETTGPFFSDEESVVNALRYLLSVHAQHPGYLRYQGKPVVFFWRQERFDVDGWAAIRAQVDAHHDSLWIAEGVDTAYQAVFDGHHLYSIAWSPDVDRTLAAWGSRIRRYASQNGVARLWVATVMPGYDDTRTDRADAFAVDREDGDYYRETWSAAVASQPDWILITSFNEWVEGTMIEPSSTYGSRYLDLTRELAAAFKSGSEAQEMGNPEPKGQALETSRQELGAEGETTQSNLQVQPFVRADEAVRVRGGPGTDYPRLGNLWPGETATVTGRNADSSWWQIEFAGADDGLGWVAAEFVTFVGDEASVPVVDRGAAATPTGEPPPTSALTPTSSPTNTPRPTASPVSTSTLTPTPTVPSVPSPTPAPTVTPPPTPSPTPTFTPTPSGPPTPTPTPTGTPMLRVTPVAQRRPASLLWIGAGALTMALGLGAWLVREIRMKR